MRFGWVLILLVVGVCLIVLSATPTVQGADDKQVEMLLQNNKWMRTRLDKVEAENKTLETANKKLQAQFDKALAANHRMAEHIRGTQKTTATTKPPAPGTTTKPGTAETDTNVDTNVKIIDLSLLSPRVETKSEAAPDKTAKPATGDEGKSTDTDVKTNVAIFDLSFLSPRVKTDTKAAPGEDPLTVMALQKEIVLRDKLIVQRDVEIGRLRTVLAKHGINPDAK